MLYQADHDHMGNHADDNQGKQIILCLVVVFPKRVCCTHIRALEFLKEGHSDQVIINKDLADGMP
jgi:hypothetical protein